ncbi:DUF6653 family protein [Pseudophaeobacter sp. 1A16562]
MPVPRIDIFALSERLMAMDDAAWARHANPLSVYSRVSILPLMTLAVWSHLWLGWGALAPVALVLIWTWWNPRAFGPPATTDSWAARGTFGERVFLNRAKVPIPPHHAQWGQNPDPGLRGGRCSVGLRGVAAGTRSDTVRSQPDGRRKTLVL